MPYQCENQPKDGFLNKGEVLMQPFYENKKREFINFTSKNLVFPPHLHSAAEILFVLEGSLIVTIDGQTKVLQEKEGGIMFPHMVHSYQSSGECRVFVCIFSPSCVKDYYTMLKEYQPKEPFFNTLDISPDINVGVMRIMDHKNQNSISRGWLNLILAYVTPYLSISPLDEGNRDNSDITYLIIDYISVHFKEPLTLEKLAEDLHFNKSYISKVFSKKLKCGFCDYINQIRLDYVVNQMRITGGKKRLMDIWQEAGFESQRTFNRVFRKNYGVTPMEYKKRV